MDEMRKRRRGRPTKPDAVRKRKNQTFRIRDEVSVRLDKAAAESGRSVSEEIEARLERSFEQERLSRFVDANDRLLGELIGITIAAHKLPIMNGGMNGDDALRYAHKRAQLTLTRQMKVLPVEAIEDDEAREKARLLEEYAEDHERQEDIRREQLSKMASNGAGSGGIFAKLLEGAGDEKGVVLKEGDGTKSTKSAD